jgi:hypothetical protein
LVACQVLVAMSLCARDAVPSRGTKECDDRRFDSRTVRRMGDKEGVLWSCWALSPSRAVRGASQEAEVSRSVIRVLFQAATPESVVCLSVD